MRVHAPLMGTVGSAPGQAAAAEAAGYDGVYTAEVANDPFLPLVPAAMETQSIRLRTAIAVAFARNPMQTAQVAHDLNALSAGRFDLGLGSQIRAHITRRFDMPWSKPAARMREFVLAMRAIWSCWYDDVPLDFRGEFYSHTLMTPMFNPPEKRFGAPRVLLAGVGPRMTEAAGEVADGLIAHAFTTPRYLREVTLPAVERGLACAGRSRADFELACPAFAISGMDAAARDTARQMLCHQIAFYGSTPAYAPVLELHGWGELHRELHTLSREGRWDEMGGKIGEEVLEEFAVIAEPENLAGALQERWGGLIDTWQCTVELSDSAAQAEIVAKISSAGAGAARG